MSNSVRVVIAGNSKKAQIDGLDFLKDTVGTLSDRIAEKTDHPRKYVRLIYMGKTLDNESQTLHDAGFNKFNKPLLPVVLLTMRCKGGKF